MKIIFIASQPRSGSTLLQSVLSNKSHVATTSEPWFLLPLLSMFDPDRVSAYYNHKLAVRAISDFTSKIGRSEVFDKAVRNFADALIIRLEDLSEKGFKLISGFFGITVSVITCTSQCSNSSKHAGSYKEVKKNIKSEPIICKTIYESRFVRHFYNQNELSGFIQQWTK